MTVAESIQLVIAIGVMIGGFGFWYQSFRQGRDGKSKADRESDSETLGFMRAQIEGLQNFTQQLKQEAKDRQDVHAAEIKQLHGQIENLKGQLAEKDKLIKHYTEVFQGRDPQLVEILQKVSGSLVQIEHFMEGMQDKVSARGVLGGEARKEAV